VEPWWNSAGTLLEHGEPCWNLAGTLLLEPLAGTFFWEPFFFLYCFLLCLLCRVVMLEVWPELCWSSFATMLEPIYYMKATSAFSLGFLLLLKFLLWQAIKDDDPMLRL
jgi:hypothetical protein